MTINHVNIVVQELEPAVDFFVRHFGFSAGEPKLLAGGWVDRLNRMKGARATYIPLRPKDGGDNATNIEALTFENPPTLPKDPDASQLDRVGYRHIAFAVDDIEARYRALSQEGWEFLSEPVEVEDMDLKTVYFYGPEGILIQMTQFHLSGCADENVIG
jgi:catechol 2,3-dioxygenase-like lactoylglutathione lyase family enzyme